MGDSVQPVETRQTPIERLCPDDYRYFKALLCPFCRARLPDTFHVERRMFMHSIPGTDELFECQAMALRLARGCVQHAIHHPDHEMVEE